MDGESTNLATHSWVDIRWVHRKRIESALNLLGPRFVDIEIPDILVKAF